jgi:hypothetical protein
MRPLEYLISIIPVVPRVNSMKPMQGLHNVGGTIVLEGFRDAGRGGLADHVATLRLVSSLCSRILH